MLPLTHLLSALQALTDLMAECCCDERDARIQVARLELEQARALLEATETNSEETSPVRLIAPPRRPTLQEALSMAISVGVTAEEAEEWWYAREATDWYKGTAGGGMMPIGRNHAADLKTFTNTVRNTRQSKNGNGRESTWNLKQQLEAVESELGRLEEKALYDSWTSSMKEKRRSLRDRREELRSKIAGIGC